MGIQDEVLAGLTRESRYSAKDGEAIIPKNFGYYAIFVNSADSLPPLFAEQLRRKDTALVYIGIAEKQTLYERLLRQDLRGIGNSTFFRGIGAMLGYLPPCGSAKNLKAAKNYKFSNLDRHAIVSWINEHLSVAWVEASPVDIKVEQYMIHNHRPLLNSAHNPDRLEALSRLRKECRRIALS